MGWYNVSVLIVLNPLLETEPIQLNTLTLQNMAAGRMAPMILFLSVFVIAPYGKVITFIFCVKGNYN